MTTPGLVDDAEHAVPLLALTAAEYPGWLEAQHRRVATWLRRMAFRAEEGTWVAVPGADGEVAMVVAGLGEEPGLWSLAGLPFELPETLTLALRPGSAEPARAALGWALGSHRFTRYRPARRAPARLVWPDAALRDRVASVAAAVCYARDLIATPAEDLGPAELATAAVETGRRGGAEAVIVVGDQLLEAGFPVVHMVGRASSRAPCLIDLTWGEPDAPAVTLVGKGVCFDTGGLNLKSAAGMARMRKDMGGAACCLAVARMVIDSGLRLRLRVLIPAVDNAVDGNAYRPHDIVRARNGTTIEVGDTDAEGRLILADALAAAAEGRPELIVDMATLTGAARVALGPDVPAVFSNRDALAREAAEAGAAAADPLWPMPLWRPYASHMTSELADTVNVADWSFADHIQAALFLERFVGEAIAWLHIDSFCWNDEDRPGRPKGGEASGARAVFALLQARYGGTS